MTNEKYEHLILYPIIEPNMEILAGLSMLLGLDFVFWLLSIVGWIFDGFTLYLLQVAYL